jgi:hypothetical protein
VKELAMQVSGARYPPVSSDILQVHLGSLLHLLLAGLYLEWSVPLLNQFLKYFLNLLNCVIKTDKIFPETRPWTQSLSSLWKFYLNGTKENQQQIIFDTKTDSLAVCVIVKLNTE